MGMRLPGLCLLVFIGLAVFSQFEVIASPAKSDHIIVCESKYDLDLLANSDKRLVENVFLSICLLGEENKEIIVFSVGQEVKAFRRPLLLGVRRFAGYSERNGRKLLLISYGYEHPDDNGNVFEYYLYGLDENRVLKSGVAPDLPKVSDFVSAK